MSDITTIIPDYLPAPDRHRKDHLPEKGNIYRDRNGESLIRVGNVARTLKDAFVLSMGNAIQREDPSIPSECIEGLVREAISWWKKKVIFTRPLSADDAKA